MQLRYNSMEIHTPTMISSATARPIGRLGIKTLLLFLLVAPHTVCTRMKVSHISTNIPCHCFMDEFTVVLAKFPRFTSAVILQKRAINIVAKKNLEYLAVRVPCRIYYPTLADVHTFCLFKTRVIFNHGSHALNFT